MDERDMILLKLIDDLSEILNVEPPKTFDLADWWDRALKEMDAFWLQILYDHDCFLRPSNTVLQKMRHRLENRVQELGLLI